jgi:L-2-hydroxyglutarate oxidase LhgO
MMFPTPPTLAPQHHIQTAIIGAGVIGLSIARSLACRRNHEVLIIEQAEIGSGISSRNSEVIHAGIYYERDVMPLKSRFCVEGKKMMYEYCKERNIPHKQCGKLIVATDVEQRDVGLPKLIELAKRIGVNDLRILSKDEVSAIEPNVVSEGAVLSPSTGIVDSHALMTSLLADAEDCGAILALHCKVDGGHVNQSAGNENGETIVLNVDGSEIECDNVIVCAGLASHTVASKILASPNNTQIDSFIPTQYCAKGNYFKLENQKTPFTRLIYPFPDPQGGLGIHATIDLAGSTKFGPDVQWLDHATSNEPESMDWNVDPSRAESFYEAIRKYWPDLKDGNIVPDYAGIRPKLLHPQCTQNGLKDFVIAGKEYHGVHGLVVLLGFESPGLTSSLAIGDHVAEMFR